MDLDRIMTSLRQGDIAPALECVYPLSNRCACLISSFQVDTPSSGFPLQTILLPGVPFTSIPIPTTGAVATSELRRSSRLFPSQYLTILFPPPSRGAKVDDMCAIHAHEQVAQVAVRRPRRPLGAYRFARHVRHRVLCQPWYEQASTTACHQRHWWWWGSGAY